MKPNLLIATGGTGGHIFPALSLEKALNDKGYRCLVVADTRFLRFQEKFRQSLEYQIIPSSSLSGNPFSLLISSLKIIGGLFAAINLILKNK